MITIPRPKTSLVDLQKILRQSRDFIGFSKLREDIDFAIKDLDVALSPVPKDKPTVAVYIEADNTTETSYFRFDVNDEIIKKLEAISALSDGSFAFERIESFCESAFLGADEDPSYISVAKKDIYLKYGHYATTFVSIESLRDAYEIAVTRNKSIFLMPSDKDIGEFMDVIIEAKDSFYLQATQKQPAIEEPIRLQRRP